MYNIAVSDTKPYDRTFLEKGDKDKKIDWHFFDFRLSATTAPLALGYDAVCSFVSDSLDKDCLEILKEGGIKHIALRCAGFNNVDIPTAQRLGMHVTRVPAYSPHGVAEHAVALLLALNRKIHQAHNRVREHDFSLDGLMGFDIYGKTVGIVGAGRIGKITAQIYRGFEANVVAYTAKQDEDPVWAKKYNVTYVPFDELLSMSDIVSLHVPLLPETFHLFNDETFSKMKDGSYLINTSRGKLIQTHALINALKSGKLHGAGLDVYEEEEGIFFEDFSKKMLLDDELARLLTFRNVIMTAHQAFFTQEAMAEIARITIENLIRFQEGKEFLPDTIVV
jgi:D-lactate dehydrogenase